jgi:hypothetical protein
MGLQPLRLSLVSPTLRSLPLRTFVQHARLAVRRQPTRWLCLALLPLAACRDGFAGFGTGARARASADQLFGALADRHVDLGRNTKYDYSRVRIMRGALAPSRVFDDTAVWTGISGDVRVLETFGTLIDGRYTMTSRSGAPTPARPADARHVTTLSHIADGQYRWDTTVDFALGSIRPADVASIVTHLLAAGEGGTEPALRAQLAAFAPRTSAALGTVFTLDSLRPVELDDATTLTTLVASVHSDNLRRRYPALADYAHKYMDPARYRVALTDRSGASFFEASQKDRVITVRVRTQHGRLVPLAGAARMLPDSLQLHVDFNVKVKIFHVGFHNLVMDFTSSARGDEQRDWAVIARREPQWDLPLITARLLRSPLRHPFAGEGALFRIGVRAGDNGAPTVLLRHSRLSVQESAILNFLNSLSGTAMDDFGGPVQREEYAWLHELFVALRDDARVALATP